MKSVFQKLNFDFSPDFPHFIDFLRATHTRFQAREGKAFFRGRNELRAFEANSTEVIIKHYKKLNLLKAFIYTYLRKTKGQRAFEYARRLEDKGFATPSPIGYVEAKDKLRLIRDVYLVTLRTYNKPVKELIENAEPQAHTALATQLGTFIAHLHEVGVLHNDLNLSNILYKKEENGSLLFELIDLNRMRFYKGDKRPPLARCLKDLARIATDDALFTSIIKAYLHARNLDDNLLQKAQQVRTTYDKRWAQRKALKRTLKFWKKESK